MILSDFYEQQIGTPPDKPHSISSKDAIRIMKMWGKYCAEKGWNSVRTCVIIDGIAYPDASTFEDFWKRFKTITEDGSNSTNN